MSLLASFFRFIAPHYCLGCGAEDYLLCPACERNLPKMPPARSGMLIWPATTYDGLAKALLYELKFNRAAGAAKDIARCIVARLPAVGPSVVSYTPTAPLRVRQRGYDQARLIARAVAQELEVPCHALLVRVGNQRQVGQGHLVRKRQMQSAFRIARPSLAANQHILLIDDVLTTGATLESAASVLQAAGAASVQGAVFAAA